jgi:L-amino acid N-acyltransferase YncA
MMRLATQDDLEDIVRIYNSYISRHPIVTAEDAPVSISDRQDWFSKRDVTRPIYVEERDARVVAWISFDWLHAMPAYRKTAAISIYVDPECRRERLGSGLLLESLRRAPSLNVETVVAFVFSQNHDSINFFTRMGFSKWGEFPNVACVSGEYSSVGVFGKALVQLTHCEA